MLYLFKFVKVLKNIHACLHNLLNFFNFLMFDSMNIIFQLINNVFKLHYVYILFTDYNLLIK